MKNILIALLLMTTPVLADSDHILPDSALTPGVVATSSWDSICGKHLSRDRSVSESTKKAVIEEYNQKYGSDFVDGLRQRIAPDGKNKGKEAGVEIDHLLPLEDGGSNDSKNLWPQPYGGDWNAHIKDKLENRLHVVICKDKITDDEVKQLQQKMTKDWISLYKEEYPNGSK